MCFGTSAPDIVERQPSRSPDGGLARSQATTVRRSGRRRTILTDDAITPGATTKKTLLGV